MRQMIIDGDKLVFKRYGSLISLGPYQPVTTNNSKLTSGVQSTSYRLHKHLDGFAPHNLGWSDHKALPARKLHGPIGGPRMLRYKLQKYLLILIFFLQKQVLSPTQRASCKSLFPMGNLLKSLSSRRTGPLTCYAHRWMHACQLWTFGVT